MARLQDASGGSSYWPKTLKSFKSECWVCIECGYIERWIKEADLSKLQKIWQKHFGTKGPIIR